MKILIAVLLVLHGLITAAFSTGSFKPAAPVQNPAWLSWWPASMGQSWLLPRPVLESPPAALLGGLLYLVGGGALIAAGLGLLGWLVPNAWSPALAVAGASSCLFMLVIYFHPLYVIGIGSNLTVLVSVLWAHWPAFMSPE